MTLEQLEKAKEIAGLREALLSRVHAVETVDCPNAVFGFLLDAEMEEVLRNACVAEIRRRAAVYEADLRELGILFPEPPPTRRPPLSWDAETGEFTFTVSSTGPERSERALGYSNYILVDQVIVPRGQVQSRHPAKIVTRGRTGESFIGEVIRVWEEDGQILGRARLFPEASAARAAVASGAVTNVAHLLNIREERVTQREGLRPLVTVEAWDIEGVLLIGDDPDLGRLDPRDECPGKAEAA